MTTWNSCFFFKVLLKPLMMRWLNPTWTQLHHFCVRQSEPNAFWSWKIDCPWSPNQRWHWQTVHIAPSTVYLVNVKSTDKASNKFSYDKKDQISGILCQICMHQGAAINMCSMGCWWQWCCCSYVPNCFCLQNHHNPTSLSSNNMTASFYQNQ